MKSVWKQEVTMRVNDNLAHDTYVNTVIIGAGMTEILTSYFLKKRGIDAIVIEKNRIGAGQTENTTAKLTSQHNFFYSKMTGKVKAKMLREYAMANENTNVMSVKGHTVYTDHGKIEAEHIVSATQYPIINVPVFYFMRQYQERSYVLALAKADMAPALRMKGN